MRVLGIDPSLTRTALALVDTDDPAGVFSPWVVSTSPEDGLAARLRRLADRCYDVAAHAAPDLIVLEDPPLMRQGRGDTVFAVPRAQGAIIAGLPSGVPVEVVYVGRWRSVLGIKMKRGAGKQPILDYMAARGYSVPTVSARSARLDADVADALGLALYGLHCVPLGGTLPAN